MDQLIADTDGVDIIISSTENSKGFQGNIDFNYGKINKLNNENKSKKWDLRLYDGKSLIGRVKFNAFQFIADGIERRTISISYIEIENVYRGQKKSYDITSFVLQQVTRDCDREWGPINTNPVLFIEKKNFIDTPRDQHSNVFNILKKIGEKILGIESQETEVPDSDLVITAIGEDISMQLLEGHLERSSLADS